MILAMLLAADALACSCGASGTLKNQVRAAEIAYQARVVGFESVDSATVRTRVKLEVRHVFKGDVAETMFAGLTSGAASGGGFVVDGCSLNLGMHDEIVIASSTPEPVLGDCGGSALVVPGRIPDGLRPIRSFALEPGPADAFVAALESCDAEGLRAGVGRLPVVPLDPLARCGSDAIAPFISWDRLPRGVVEEGRADVVLELVERHPETGPDTIRRAARAGRVDIVTPLADRYAEHIRLDHDIPRIPEIVAAILDAGQTDLGRHSVWACFRESPTATRSQRHETARLLFARGAPRATYLTRPPPELVTAVEDGFPDADVIAWLDALEPERRAKALPKVLNAAVSTGRTALFDVLWTPDFDTDTLRLTRLACAADMQTLEHLLGATRHPRSTLGCGCVTSAVASRDPALITAIAGVVDAKCFMDDGRRAWLWREGHPDLIRRVVEVGGPVGGLELSSAVGRGDPEVVRIALEQGVDPDVDGGRRTALELLVRSTGDFHAPPDPANTLSIARLLIDAGADVSRVERQAAYLPEAFQDLSDLLLDTLATNAEAEP